MSLAKAKEALIAYAVTRHFDKTGTDAKLSNFNTLVASRFLKNNMSTAFNNEAVLILKNNNIGGDCIAE